MRLLLIRHGESTANAEGRWQGHADFSLSERGRRESERLAERLAAWPIDALYTSPLRRARETAETVAARLGLALVEQAALMEFDAGEMSGLTREEVLERFPEYVEARRAGRTDVLVPGMESPDGFRRRVQSALEEIIAAHPQGTVAVVTHGGPIGFICRHALGLPMEGVTPFAFANASITTLDVREGEGAAVPPFRLIGLNDTCHLDGL